MFAFLGMLRKIEENLFHESSLLFILSISKFQPPLHSFFYYLPISLLIFMWIWIMDKETKVSDIPHMSMRTSPSRAWLRLNALLVLACLLACLPACLPVCLLACFPAYSLTCLLAFLVCLLALEPPWTL